MACSELRLVFLEESSFCFFWWSSLALYKGGFSPFLNGRYMNFPPLVVYVMSFLFRFPYRRFARSDNSIWQSESLSTGCLRDLHDCICAYVLYILPLFDMLTLLTLAISLEFEFASLGLVIVLRVVSASIILHTGYASPSPLRFCSCAFVFSWAQSKDYKSRQKPDPNPTKKEKSDEYGLDDALFLSSQVQGGLVTFSHLNFFFFFSFSCFHDFSTGIIIIMIVNIPS